MSQAALRLLRVMAVPSSADGPLVAHAPALVLYHTWLHVRERELVGREWGEAASLLRPLAVRISATAWLRNHQRCATMWLHVTGRVLVPTEVAT